MMPGTAKQYEFYIVVLTKQGKLVDAYVRGSSFSNALDKMIQQLDLAGNIAEYRFCVRKEAFTHYKED